MGLGIEAKCDCGYTEADLVLGGLLHSSCVFVPVLCRGCKRVVSADVAQEGTACPICKTSAVIRYDDPRMSDQDSSEIAAQWGAHELTKAGHLCPRCKRYSLSFSTSGDFYD